MKASELRIGNIVDNNGYGEWIISDGSDIDFSEKNCKGTPLTKEWLLKFGAEKKGSFYKINLGNNIGNININPDNGVVWLKHDNNNSTMLNPKSIYFVHELQNLYFALTGEELHL